MAGIRGQNTKGEIVLRKALHKRGLRYRVNVRTLPGKPDIVLPKYHAVVLFNGCFWHGHGCHRFSWPKTRAGFWRTKIEDNRARDERVKAQLESADWRVGTVWECALMSTHSDHGLLLDDIASWIQSETGSREWTG